MAVIPMQKINIYGLAKNRKRILEMLQRKGVVEPVDLNATEYLQKKDTLSQISQFNDQLGHINKAIEILNRCEPPEKKPFYEDIEKLSRESISKVRKKANPLMKEVNKVINLSDRIEEITAEISRTKLEILTLAPWEDMALPMNFKGTKNTASFIGSIQGLRTQEYIESAFGEDFEIKPNVDIISSSKEKTCIVVTVHKNVKEQAEQVLKEINFVSIGLDCESVTPKQKIEQLLKRKQALEKETETCQSSIKELVKQRRDMEILHDCVESRSSKYRVLSQLGIGQKTFVMSGFIEQSKVEVLTELLENRYDAYLECAECDEGEDPPVKLKNNAFTEPVEGVLEAYSMPTPQDIDPTGIMAFFYYFFFGMMFSDAGYGLLVMIVCGFLGFIKKDVKPSLKKSMKMFFYCGVSTVFWGVMYGSFFGNVINVVGQEMFKLDISFEPVMLDPIEKPLELMLISCGFGLVQILFALGMNFYKEWRNGNKWDAVFDSSFWMITLTGIGLFAGGALLSAQILSTIGMYMALAGLVGVVLTGGRKSKNIFAKLFMGIIHLYDITGYFSDILSYARLMALGLATGIIATMMNTIGSIMGFGVGGTILFILVFIFGHAINFAINMLGAYVHTNRLQYVEFFSKFYEGGSKKFQPFSFKSKYIQFKEEI